MNANDTQATPPADRDLSPISIKTAARRRANSGQRALGWSDVLRAVPREIVRQRVTERFRATGYTPDDVGRFASARAALADVLTRTKTGSSSSTRG
jgi:hypothetical protein